MNEIRPMSADAYHADKFNETPSLSSSIAKILLDQSPMHAWLAHPRLNPNYVRETDTRFDLGSASHTMLLEPANASRVVIVDANDWRTNAAKALRDAEQAQGKYPILTHQFANVAAMVKAAREFLATTELAGILETGTIESSMFWQSGPTHFRARPDVVSADHRITLDYKTSATASPEIFELQIGRMKYDLQAEFYSAGIYALTGVDTKFIFLVQEITAPFACSLVGLTSAYRAVGQMKLARSIDIWKQCMSTKKWPAYPNTITFADPKPWQLAQAEEMAAANETGDETTEHHSV